MSGKKRHLAEGCWCPEKGAQFFTICILKVHFSSSFRLTPTFLSHFPQIMSLITSLLLVAFHIYHISATCYNPDGSEIKDPAYQACNQFAGSVSQCCGTNHTGVVAPDTCQANGLCQNNGDSVYWRQGCTDKTWKR